MNEKILADIGLSLEQARVYLALLQNGLSPVKSLTKQTGLGRALCYKILGELTELRLVEKRENNGTVTLFLPAHPSRIKEMLTEKERRIANTTSSFHQIFGELASSYNLLFGKPNVQFYEGVEGMRTVYEDILDVNQEIRIISSPIGKNEPEHLHLIKEQIKKQAAQNIKTKAISPLADTLSDERKREDEAHLIERKVVPASELGIPAQIIMYGDKVAITNFKETMTTVAVESKYIAETFRLIFEYMWKQK